MQTEALAISSRKTEQLRYVTEHFGDLRSMIGAPAILLLTLWSHWARLGWDAGNRTRFFAFPILLLLGVLIGGRIRNGYRDKFGFVQPAPIRILDTQLSALQRPNIWRYGVLFLALSTIPMTSAAGWTVGALQIVSAALYLFVPRCAWIVPLNPLLYMRKLLAWAGVVAILGATGASFYWNQQGLLLLYVASSSFVAMAAYDHWLLTHFLPTPRKEALHG